MKATGVVRRIDDLGRVVIPKEIRKTLRIREGDPLEIFTDKEGEVILKKYSPIGELSEFASKYTETLAKTTGMACVITDKDTVVALSGAPKKEYIEKNISSELERLIEDRVYFFTKEKSDKSIPITIYDDNSKYNSQIVYPIIADGDTVGSIALLSTENKGRIGETELKLTQSVAMLLGKQMEN